MSPLMRQEGEVLPSVTFKTRVRTDEEGDNPFDWKDQHVESALLGAARRPHSSPPYASWICATFH